MYGGLNAAFYALTRGYPRLASFVVNNAYVAKRRHASGVDWTRALAKAMASNRDLRTQTALARRSGVAQSTIGRILRGEVNPQSVNLERIAKAFNLSLAELAAIGQEGVPVPEPADEIKRAEKSTRVALISWAQASLFADTPTGFEHIDGPDWMPRPKLSGAKTFSLRVRGESMEPDYQHGDVIFVDPDIDPRHGKDVLAVLGDREEFVFRRLVVEGELEYLRPTNPNSPAKIINLAAHPDARIIGVVVGKWVQK